jgi:hypothetical protein
LLRPLQRDAATYDGNLLGGVIGAVLGVCLLLCLMAST